MGGKTQTCDAVPLFNCRAKIRSLRAPHLPRPCTPGGSSSSYSFARSPPPELIELLIEFAVPRVIVNTRDAQSAEKLYKLYAAEAKLREAGAKFFVLHGRCHPKEQQRLRQALWNGPRLGTGSHVAIVSDCVRTTLQSRKLL